jgi:hypothetical protein
MTKAKNDTCEKSLWLTDALVDDVLNLSDDEILAEAREDYDDPNRAAQEVSNAIQNVLLKRRKARLLVAQKAYQEHLGRSAKLTRTLSFSEKRALIQRIKSNDAAFNEKLTMAARKEDELSENDLDSIINAFLELGLIDENGNLR